MSNDIKVGDKLRRITEAPFYFTKGKDYEVSKIGVDSVQTTTDEGYSYLLSDSSVRDNFTIIRETPQLVKADGHIRTGSLVRVVAAEPTEDDNYENGDVFEVGLLWGSGDGITTTQGIELWMYEVEKVTDEQAKVDLTLGSPGVSNDAVNQPNHYTNGKFEVIEVIEEITKGYKDGFIAYDIGNVTKYIARAPYKHDTPLEDLRKAARYLDYAIKRQEELEGND